ncbi:MAG: Z1 domain-containing protein [Candidatus Pacearchaeota archaeon]|nr:Z1 domain-containing protein [Candidatus Pacearchaeota archaeon]
MYSKNFIINLPKPYGYFGAEELFGSSYYIQDEVTDGIDVIRTVSDTDFGDHLLEKFITPPIMEKAILSFVLAGAARSYRSKGDFPATMLIHISLRTLKQEQLKEIIEKKFTEFKDEWRYSRRDKIYNQLHELWEEDFLPVINTKYCNQLRFEELEQSISTFFESIQIRTLNSISGDSQVLDYEKEPNLKIIAIGGNKLSRGLTLEGLLVSFFTRRTTQYDTLMQMGRWFGFRLGYEDLTRIYTTPELAGWFSDLAQVESGLREDIKIYEEQQLTPFEVSQTIKFPLDNLEVLSKREENNLLITKEFLSNLGNFTHHFDEGPFWGNVPADKVISFLSKFQTDESAFSFCPSLIIEYIKKLNENNELIKWNIAICGKKSVDNDLGEVDWGLKDIKIKQISRSQENKNRNSLKSIVSQGDELKGLSSDQIKEVEKYVADGKQKNNAARLVRDPSEGLILLYPISKYSKPEVNNKNRIPLYEDPKDPLAKNLIGIAISFPYNSKVSQDTQKYIEGTVSSWRSSDAS